VAQEQVEMLAPFAFLSPVGVVPTTPPTTTNAAAATVGRVVSTGTTMTAETPKKYEPRKAGWLPGSYAPLYLDGSLPGDVGFDPLCLVALAQTGLDIDSGPWLSVDRKARMVMCSEYEAKKKVAWMREAEVRARTHERRELADSLYSAGYSVPLTGRDALPADQARAPRHDGRRWMASLRAARQAAQPGRVRANRSAVGLRA
jgi:hypothetical protein